MVVIVIRALTGPVMPYAWGSPSALAELLGHAPSGQPEAELWIGAHPSAPARLAGAESTLADLLAQDLPGLLGQDLVTRFGRLPFLLKILAIEQPLSLQAHPDREQARQGFAREEALGLSRSDPTRSYKDDNHKPELILALTPVEALCGFRSKDEVIGLLSVFGLTAAESPLAVAAAAFATSGPDDGYEALFRSFFQLSPADLGASVALALTQARGLSSHSDPGADLAWVARYLLSLGHAYGSDPGLLAMLLLRPLRLEPGQAVFLPARRLHAYLSGVGVEVMAESDNVLRGGLTPKHVDIHELCRVLDFVPSAPDRITPSASEFGASRALVYRTPVPEFELWSIDADPSGDPVELPTPSLLVVLEGEVEITQGAHRERVRRGGQAFVSWSTDRAWLVGHGRVALATTGQIAPRAADAGS